MRVLYPLGDVDLLDAYHLSGGRVVNFRTSGADWSSHASGIKDNIPDYRVLFGQRRQPEGGTSTGAVESASTARNTDDCNFSDEGGGRAIEVGVNEWGGG